jgi:predicted DCC family thiol-disulfide oxidoreductase YuxK
MMELVAQTARPVILFDGVCHLCNGFVQFVLAHDAAARFDFAALQSDFARSRLGERPMDSVVLIDGGRQYEAERAAIRILAVLDRPWSWIGVSLRWVPDPLLAWGYRLVARNRYRWFGRDEVCAMPRQEWKGRFL